jgi:hypothetical protein
VQELEGIGTDPPTTWVEGNPPVIWTMPGAPFTGLYSGYPYSCFSSTIYNTDDVWSVDMANGYVYHYYKISFNYVWPVRGGN